VLSLPFSLQSFAKLRNLQCLYVDKTKYAHDLIVQGQNFFLSRPRRFGKSLFISTLKEILLGKKELFEGLWIQNSSYSWPVYGVIHLDFSFLKSTHAAILEQSLCKKLLSIAREYDIVCKGYSCYQCKIRIPNPSIAIRHRIFSRQLDF
jgi:aspartyl-tRNA synthetase